MTSGKPIVLDDVTLVSITGVNSGSAQLAMQRSMEQIRFKRALLIATEAPTAPDPHIEWIKIPPMNLREYSRFVLQDLYRYFDTSHILIVQADGFVANPQNWNPAWLQFDYVGAPWPEKLRSGKYVIPLVNRVGNGGFSLRSRRLLELVSPINLATMRFPTRNEDLIICYLLHQYLTERGMRFADIETAASFSIESPSAAFGHTLDTTFGFHGKYYLAQLAQLSSRPAEA